MVEILEDDGDTQYEDIVGAIATETALERVLALRDIVPPSVRARYFPCNETVSSDSVCFWLRACCGICGVGADHGCVACACAGGA